MAFRCIMPTMGAIELTAPQKAQVQMGLRNAGLSAVGAQQFVNGLPIASATDRKALVAILVTGYQTGGSGHGINWGNEVTIV